MTMVQVVCLSYLASVSEERRVALKKAGYDVVATTVVERARAAVLRRRTDVLVIGRHFTDAESGALVDLARKLWGAGVVVVTGVGAQPDARADFSVPVLDGAAGIVKAVEATVERMVAA